MLALPPTLFSTTYGWPLEDNIAQQDCNDVSINIEANSYISLLDFPSYDQSQHDCAPESCYSGGAIHGNIGDPNKVSKKLNHNASERDRRKRVNDLYAYLRSLLRMSADQKKKVSIPGTVSRALKYIPELRKEVETLLRKKENLSSYSTSTIIGIERQSTKDAMINTNSSVVSSVSVLSDKEVVIQLIYSSDRMSNNKETASLSRVLEYLESEENGFVLLNLTTFKCPGEETLLHTLHLQVQGDNYKVEAEILKEKLCTFGKHLEKIHVTWTQFGKKRDKNATLWNFDQVLVRRRHDFHLTHKEFKATASQVFAKTSQVFAMTSKKPT
ncbi:achaete-scute transcription factor-related protein [Tanacetum coccineum]